MCSAVFVQILQIIKVLLLFELSASTCLGKGTDAHSSQLLITDAKDGETVNLECKQTTDVLFWQGPPNYTTYASGSRINPSIKKFERLSIVNNGRYDNLIITNVSKEDEGSYKCLAGEADTFFELRIHSKMDNFHRSTIGVTKYFGVGSFTDNIKPGKPKTPENLKSVYAKENEVSVTWQSDLNVYPLSFIVEYRPKDQNTWTPHGVAEKVAVIKGLQPDTEYYFRVFSKQGNETSDASNEIIVITESSSSHGVFVIVSLLFVGVAVAIIVFVVYFVFGKGKQIKIKNLSCLKRQSVDNSAMGAVQNNFYDIQNNTATSAAARNTDLPVYSSIDRRLNLNHVKQNVSYDVSQKKSKKDSDGMLRMPKLVSTTNQTESSSAEPYKTGKNELCYTEICFESTQDSCRIRTRESKSPYADVDLSKTAQKLPSDDDEENEDEDFAEIEDVKKMKRKTVIK